MQNTNENDDIVEIDLQELFGLLVHWLWLIVLCGVAAAAVGFAVSNFLITPKYESETRVYIINRQNENTLTYSDVQLGSQLTKDYAQLIKSRTVLEKVIETCGLTESYEELAARVAVEALSDTRIIAITVTDYEPAMAQYLANEIREVAAEHIKNVMDIEAVNVADEANLPKNPASPSVTKWTGLGFLFGVFLCAMILIIKYLMDDTIKTSDDVEKYMGLSTLAMIPVLEEPDKRKKRHKKGGYTSGQMEEASRQAAERAVRDVTGRSAVTEGMEESRNQAGMQDKDGQPESLETEGSTWSAQEGRERE